jgi:hypothetical protein
MLPPVRDEDVRLWPWLGVGIIVLAMLFVMMARAW